MAVDLLSERVRSFAAHAAAAAALGYASRASDLASGWLHVPVRDPDPDAPLLSVIVPARNEQRSIERCVRSLAAQTLPGIELIVVDDRSDDETPEILARLEREIPALRVVHGAELPAGWVGKPWALAQGARVARGSWLLFTDADSTHAAHACASTLAFVRERGADALTLWTFQELGSFAERAILPAILGMVLMASGTMSQLNDPHDTEHALANGQYILVSREAYDALGGHDALRGEILDDVNFARRLKADGRFRLVLADGADHVRVRMYTSLGELWEGFTKNMYLGANGDIATLAGAAAFLAMLSVVPAAIAADAIARGKTARACEAFAALGLGIAVAARGYERARIPRRFALLAPLGYAACGAIMLNSTLRIVSGRGVSWRGRRYTGRVGGEQP
ncbi:glycosyl transferase [Vulcanimicrobium alpinum]|uniref:Glycosyl transferase n=1 Tax=Vulcanimicrobium alpinum TaxID=3016050 RepID=A0AAN1XV27_UNVUL|nr:glycosyltransferase family 2 protein [Vulcanimicrobium alpinum]BDE05514.1 glycosyl transferase [Vulcanimicrobium alpinum]